MEEKNIDLERKKKHMQYAIHTNELEGFVYEPEEIEFLMNVAEGKIGRASCRERVCLYV